MRLALGVLGHVHQLEHLLHAGIDLGLGHLVLLQAKGDVLRHGHVREQCIRLEHHVDRPLVGRHVGDVDAIEEDSPFGRALEAGQHAQQGRFARTGATQQGKDLAFADFQRHIVYGDGFVEFFRDPVDLDQHLLGLLATLEGFLIGTGGNCMSETPNKICVPAPALRRAWIVTCPT